MSIVLRHDHRGRPWRGGTNRIKGLGRLRLGLYSSKLHRDKRSSSRVLRTGQFSASAPPVPTRQRLSFDTSSTYSSGPQHGSEGLYILALESTERTHQGAKRGEFQRQRYVSLSRRYAYRLLSKHSPRSTIRILNQSDGPLLNVFHLYRLFFLGKDVNEIDCLMGGERWWARERWWYKLAHVCQRWQGVVHVSTYYLGVSLVCSNDTPTCWHIYLPSACHRLRLRRHPRK